MTTARVSTSAYSASTSTTRPDVSVRTRTGSSTLMSASDACSQSPPIARCRTFAVGGTVTTIDPEDVAIVSSAPAGLTVTELSVPAAGAGGCGEGATVANNNAEAIVA